MARTIEVDTNLVEWRPMRYPGISSKPLRRDPAAQDGADYRARRTLSGELQNVLGDASDK